MIMPRFKQKDKRLPRLLCLALLLAALPLAACGIKPGALQSPQGEKDTSFPRTYPTQP